MKLIDILVQELPKRGGWPDGGILSVQDCDKWICFSTLPEVEISGLGEWVNHDGGWVSCIKNCEHLAEDYSKSIITREQYEAALAASKPEWDGEGLPPVGTVCEYIKKSLTVKEWTECTIDYVGSSFIVYRDCYGVEFTSIKCDIEFRPIRSEADKKKEAAIFAIAELCRGSASNGHSAELIYDAIKSGKILID